MRWSYGYTVFGTEGLVCQPGTPNSCQVNMHIDIFNVQTSELFASNHTLILLAYYGFLFVSVKNGSINMIYMLKENKAKYLFFSIVPKETFKKHIYALEIPFYSKCFR